MPENRNIRVFENLRFFAPPGWGGSVQMPRGDEVRKVRTSVLTIGDELHHVK